MLPVVSVWTRCFHSLGILFEEPNDTQSQAAKDFILKQREIQSRCAAGEQQALSKDALTS